MPPGRQITIGQLGQRAGIPSSTVRYYERIGLLVPEDRSQGNYRLYGQASLVRLRLIRAAQSIGFTLDDIQALLGESGREPSCHEVQQLLEKRLDDITQRLKDLQHVQRVLKTSLRKCRQTGRAGTCHVMEDLGASPSRSTNRSASQLARSSIEQGRIR
jgi:DNA-binding transcriptional MerR regulator